MEFTTRPLTPPARSRRRRALALVAALLASLAPAAAVPSRAAAAPFESRDEAGQLFSWINQARLEHGRDPLVRDERLDALALKKAWDMAENGYFDHVSPAYGTVFDMLQAAGISYKWAGENIARAGGAEQAHAALMQSPDHRANILSAGYTHVGVGAVRVGRRLYIAQVFARPRDPAAAARGGAEQASW